MGKREDLIANIMTQYETEAGGDVPPVVGLEEFFDGNADQYSIAANLVGFGHPGLEEFCRILRGVKREPTVQDVLIAIHETPYPEDPEDAAIWPDSDTVYVLTSAPAEEVATWVRPLRVDDIGEGWMGGIKPRAAPEPQPGMKVLALWWD
jgi:hypothetical protein